MKRVLFFVVALMFAISSKAADVKVQTASVGEVTVKCVDKAWKIDVKVVERGGREEISVEMTAPQALTPPQLSVEFSRYSGEFAVELFNTFSFFLPVFFVNGKKFFNGI